MKKKAFLFITFICTIAVLALVHLIGHHNELKKYNLVQPQKRVVMVDGKSILVNIYKYNPPYKCPVKLIESKNELSYRNPEETKEGMWSSIGRDKEWYLSLYDKEAQGALIERDKNSGGKILEEYDKGKPLREGFYDEFLYKVEAKIGGKEYAIIHMNTFINGEALPVPTYVAFVREKGMWLKTNELENNELKKMVGLKSYEDFMAVTSNPRISVPLITIISAVILILIYFGLRFFIRK